MDVCFILLGCFGQVIVLALASFFFGRLAWPFLPLRFSIGAWIDLPCPAGGITNRICPVKSLISSPT